MDVKELTDLLVESSQRNNSANLPSWVLFKRRLLYSSLRKVAGSPNTAH